MQEQIEMYKFTIRKEPTETIKATTFKYHNTQYDTSTIVLVSYRPTLHEAIATALDLK